MNDGNDMRGGHDARADEKCNACGEIFGQCSVRCIKARASANLASDTQPDCRHASPTQGCGYCGTSIANGKYVPVVTQPEYTNCGNCGCVDHGDYLCPCNCHQ